MISRREFLTTGAMGALAMATSRFPAAEAETPHRFGVQLYVLRDLLAKDFDGTLAKVAGMGIETVEFSGFYDRTAPEVRASLANAGLTATGAHCLRATMPDDDVGRTIDFCHQVGLAYMIAAVPSIRPATASGSGQAPSRNPFEHIDLEDWRWDAERFNSIGARPRRGNALCVSQPPA